MCVVKCTQTHKHIGRTCSVCVWLNVSTCSVCVWLNVHKHTDTLEGPVVYVCG